jgi:hypothetical protein
MMIFRAIMVTTIVVAVATTSAAAVVTGGASQPASLTLTQVKANVSAALPNLAQLKVAKWNVTSMLANTKKFNSSDLTRLVAAVDARAAELRSAKRNATGMVMQELRDLTTAKADLLRAAKKASVNLTAMALGSANAGRVLLELDKAKSGETSKPGKAVHNATLLRQLDDLKADAKELRKAAKHNATRRADLEAIKAHIQQLTSAAKADARDHRLPSLDVKSSDTGAPSESVEVDTNSMDDTESRRRRLQGVAPFGAALPRGGLVLPFKPDLKLVNPFNGLSAPSRGNDGKHSDKKRNDKDKRHGL